MHHLPWLLVNLVQWTLGLTGTALGIVAALAVRVVSGSREAPLRMARWLWAPGLLAVTGARLRVDGGEEVDFSRPALYVANHQSTLDIAVAYRAVRAPLAFVLKQELARIPFLGWYVRAMGMVVLDRRRRASAAASVEATAALLRSGRSVLTFPEGTRSRDGRLGAFKPGAFAAALEAGVPVVPIAIEGTARVMPAAWIRSRPGRVRARVGTPIATRAAGPASSRERAALAERCRDAVVDLLGQLRGEAARSAAAAAVSVVVAVTPAPVDAGETAV